MDTETNDVFPSDSKVFCASWLHFVMWWIRWHVDWFCFYNTFAFFCLIYWNGFQGSEEDQRAVHFSISAIPTKNCSMKFFHLWRNCLRMTQNLSPTLYHSLNNLHGCLKIQRNHQSSCFNVQNCVFSFIVHLFTVEKNVDHSTSTEFWTLSNTGLSLLLEYKFGFKSDLRFHGLYVNRSFVWSKP